MKEGAELKAPLGWSAKMPKVRMILNEPDRLTLYRRRACVAFEVATGGYPQKPCAAEEFGLKALIAGRRSSRPDV